MKTLSTYSYISPRYKAHKALTFSFRPSCRFAVRAEPSDSPMIATQFIVCPFSSIIPLYVVLGKPGLMKRYET